VLALDQKVDELNKDIQETVLQVAMECPDDIASVIIIGKIARTLKG